MNRETSKPVGGAGRRIVSCLGVAGTLALMVTAGAAETKSNTEAWVTVPMPPGFRVQPTDMDGPVFADAAGHTLYFWPFKALRNNGAGETKGKPTCYGKVLKQTAGLMSPYPPGIILPELDKRPACTDLWQPVKADKGAQTVGKWTVLARTGGTQQWAYDEHPLYTSVKDHNPGDVNGTAPHEFPRADGDEVNDAPAYRLPMGPPSEVPPGFAVRKMPAGRMLVTDKGWAVYAYDKDSATKSACDQACTRDWPPLLAPQLARANGEWTLIDRALSQRQWAFRGKPLYTHAGDRFVGSQEGSDTPGWTNVLVQRAPAPPPGFTIQDTIAGSVVADSSGRTVYVYNCGDDSQDQLSCDHPDDTQVYRLAICGGGDVAKCRENWPYVVASPGAKSNSQIWSVLLIDPATGHRAKPGRSDALAVWAYRDRPVYTFARDKRPGDVYGDAVGEWRGERDGYKAMWTRLEMLEK